MEFLLVLFLFTITLFFLSGLNKNINYKIFLLKNFIFKKIMKKNITYVLVNINNFKKYNLKYGRKEGDNIIKDLKKRLEKKYNYAYNYFQDNIVLLLNSEKYDIDKEIEYIHNIYIKKKYVVNKNIEHVINLFVVSLVLDDNILVEDYINLFEQTIRKTKINYKTNKYELKQTIEEKDEIKLNNFFYKKNILEDCFSNNERFSFILFKQQILNLNDMNMKKYELLIRIEDKENNNIILPNFFINEIQNSISYLSLFNDYLMKSIVKICNKNKNIIYSINISPKEISNSNIVDNMIKYLSNLKYSNLIIEIIENEQLVNNDIVNKFFKFCNENNIKIAIDDFGSGYSNLEYIFNNNFKILKFDGSLIKEIDKDRKKYSLIKNITRFCIENNIETVAEFIENKEIYNKCKELGINYLQGYYIHKPEKI